MTDQSAFNSEESSVPSEENTQTDTSVEDLLSSIKNENGERKYDSIPKALEGLRNAQEFIPQLKTEMSQKDVELQQLREELAKRESAEDIVNRITAKQESESLPTDKGLDEQQLVEVVQNILNQNSVKQTEKQNFETVNRALIEQFGGLEGAQKAVATKAEELGISATDIEALSRKSPKAALAYFGGATSPSLKTQSGTLNTSGFQEAPKGNELERPTKSLLSGATSREQAEYMKKIKDKVYEDLGVTT